MASRLGRGRWAPAAWQALAVPLPRGVLRARIPGGRATVLNAGSALCLAAQDARSPPSQKRRTDDSTSTGELQPMPTSPAAGAQSPAAPDALFSSPPQFRHSGTGAGGGGVRAAPRPPGQQRR